MFYSAMVSFNITMLVLSILGGLPAVNIAIWAVASILWSGAAYMRYRSRR